MSQGRHKVVDDNPNLLELIRMRLESANLRLWLRQMEEQATQALKEQLFDLVSSIFMLGERRWSHVDGQFRLNQSDVPTIILPPVAASRYA